MKVCMVSKHFFPYAGGLEARVLELAKWLVEKKHDVQVVTAHEEGTLSEETVSGIKVKRSPDWFSLFNAPFNPGILTTLLRSDYDLIDVNLPDPVNSVFAYIGSVLRRKPLVVTYHADIVREGLFHLPFKALYYPILWLVLRRAQRILVTSPNYAESSSFLSGFMDKVTVASSFVDTQVFNPKVDGGGVRQELGIGNRKMVLFVGRLVAYKGLDYLIRASKELGDVVLVIVGEGQEEERLKDVAKEAGEGNVVFTGLVGDDSLPQYYAACDVFVLPSVTRQEAFGLVLVEAMASGKPVVSSNFSGMPYVVGDAGLLVEPRDPGALAEAVNRLLGDDALSSKLGSLGRKRAVELFSIDAVCSIVEGVYKSSCNR